MGKPHASPSLKLTLGSTVLIGIPLLYFIFLPVSYSFDGTVFSHMFRRALLHRDWLAPVQFHHLLYFPLNYLICRLLEALFHYRVLEFFHSQLFSLFFGIASLFVIERILNKLGLDLPLRLASVVMVAFSYAFWLFTVDAKVHIPGFFSSRPACTSSSSGRKNSCCWPGRRSASPLPPASTLPMG